MALNKMFGYKAIRALSVTKALINSDVAGAGLVKAAGGELEINLAAEKGLEIVSDALGIKLASSDALELDAGGLDLKSAIAGNRTFEDDLIVEGNLVVNGTTTTVNSTVVNVADRLLHLNSAADGDVPVPVGLAGISIHRGDVAGVARDHAGLVWDEANQRFAAAFLGADEAEAIVSYLNMKMGDVEAGNVTMQDLDVQSVDVHGTVDLDGGSIVATGVAGGAAEVISFAKDAAETGWGAKAPANIAQALNDLADLIQNASAGAAGDLVTYFNELRSNGVLGTADAIGEIAGGDLPVFEGGRVVYVAGTRYAMAADSFDAGALADGTYKLFVNAAGALTAAADYPAAPAEYAAIAEIVVAGGAVTDATDEHFALVALDQRVVDVQTTLNNFVALVAGVNGAANVGISNALATALGINAGDTVEQALSALDTALDAEIVRATAEEADIRADFATADAAILTSLASTANAEGASLIGVEDSAGKFTAATVEGVLAELQGNIEAETTARDAMRMQKVRLEITQLMIDNAVAGKVEMDLGAVSYKVGSDALVVFADGIAQDNVNPEFYTEQAGVGGYATKLDLNAVDLIAGMKIMVWVSPFKG